MDCYWLLTSTFYGNWLPGDPRGFVSRVRDARAGEPVTESRHEHDIPKTPYDEDFAGLYRYAQTQMRGPPIRIDREQAEALLNQFHETATYRGWKLLAVAIMANHVHLVVGANGNVDPTKMLGDFKAYGSRALNRRWGKPQSGTWWTYDGSKRRISDDQVLHDKIEYVRAQAGALIVWLASEHPGP